MSQKKTPFIRGFTRCWEISSAHVTDEAASYLADLADIATPTRFRFVAFRIPYSPTIGVRLDATPWTDANLRQIEGITAAELRKTHLDKDMPEHLVEILHLAACAGARILIFDADAPILDGLPVFDD